MLGNWFQSSMTLWVKKLLLMVVLVLRLVSLVLSCDCLVAKRVGKTNRKERKKAGKV